MKRLILAAGLLLGISGAVFASDISYSTVTSKVFTSTQNVDFDLNAAGLDMASIQIIYSSASPNVCVFKDGTTSTGSVTFAALTSLTTTFAYSSMTVLNNSPAIAASATITVLSTTGLSGQSLTINNGINSYTFTADTNWISSGVSTATAAINLGNVLRGSSNYLLITATGSILANSPSVVFATAVVGGLNGNTFTMTSSSPTVMRASATFTGGLEKSLYQQKLTIVTSTVSVILTEGKQWAQLDVASNTAISISTAMNNALRGIFFSTASLNIANVYSTAAYTGSYANAFSITSSTSGIRVASATFINGQDNATIYINGYPYAANAQWFVQSTASATAKNFSDRFMSSTTAGNLMYGYLNSSWTPQGLFTATATYVGSNGNYSLSVTTTALTVSGASMSGGTDTSISFSSAAYFPFAYSNVQHIYPANAVFNANSIKSTTTSWGTGQALLLSKTAGTYPGPLVNATTYYAFNISASSFSIADTSTNAFAGNGITFTSQLSAGGGTFVFTPIAIAGTPTFKLQKSNDGINYQDVFMSTQPAVAAPYQASVSFASPYTSTNIIWEIGNVYCKWLRLAFTNTFGGVNIAELINGKSYAKSNR